MAAAASIVRNDQGAVAVLTLNRPAKRNAITTAMMWELGDHIRRIQRDDKVRAVLIAGAGPHFSAGGDMQEMLKMGILQTDGMQKESTTVSQAPAAGQRGRSPLPCPLRCACPGPAARRSAHTVRSRCSSPALAFCTIPWK